MSEMRIDPRVALEPRDRNEAWTLAKVAVESGFFAVKSPAEALVILMTGRELGLTAMQSLRGIYVVKGRPMVSADAMVACVMADPRCELWQPVESTDKRCVIRTKRRGMTEPVEGVFTMDDAKAAQLTGSDMYRKYPRVMLRHRCAAELVREVYPDVVLGIYCEGEVPGEDPRGYVSTPPADVSEGEPAPRELPATTNAPTLDTGARKVLDLAEFDNVTGKPVARPASQPPPTKEHAAPKTEPAAQETTPANDPAPAESYVLAAFKECVSEIDLPGEAVAVWIKNRLLLATIPAAERQAAWEVLCAKTEEVGKMKSAKVWLKKAIAEEDARRQGDNSSPDDKPPTGTDGPRSACTAPATGDAASAPVESTAAPVGAPAAHLATTGHDLRAQDEQNARLALLTNPVAVLASYRRHATVAGYLDRCALRCAALDHGRDVSGWERWLHDEAKRDPRAPARRTTSEKTRRVA